MTKIERRRRVVKLPQGNYEAELSALFDKALAAKRAEAIEAATASDDDAEVSGPPRRAGQKAQPKTLDESVRLGAQYDALLNEAEETAVEVTVWAIGHDEWSQLSDDHPPRDDILEDKERGVAAQVFLDDKQRGVNTKTFPPLLLKAALVDPDIEVTDLEDRIAKGSEILAELGLSRVHYVKLETAAWNVNVGDDALPKFSLVSLLTEGSDGDSKPPHGLE